jgi:hypothetical protein
VVVATPAEVREKFRRVKPFGEITAGRRCCAAPILGQSGSSAPPCWTLDVLNIVLVSATVPVAVCTVPLRTSSTPSVRRDADRRERGARVPHFTRELEKLHPDISKAEGSHRRHGYGGQERLKAEVKTKTKLTPTATCAITPKQHGAGIRQQLQVLRDLGLLLHIGRGIWRLP